MLAAEHGNDMEADDADADLPDQVQRGDAAGQAVEDDVDWISDSGNANTVPAETVINVQLPGTMVDDQAEPPEPAVPAKIRPPSRKVTDKDRARHGAMHKLRLVLCLTREADRLHWLSLLLSTKVCTWPDCTCVV